MSRLTDYLFVGKLMNSPDFLLRAWICCVVARTYFTAYLLQWSCTDRLVLVPILFERDSSMDDKLHFTESPVFSITSALYVGSYKIIDTRGELVSLASTKIGRFLAYVCL